MLQLNTAVSLEDPRQQPQQQIKMPSSPWGCHAKLEAVLYYWVAPHLPTWGFWSGRQLHLFSSITDWPLLL